MAQETDAILLNSNSRNSIFLNRKRRKVKGTKEELHMEDLEIAIDQLNQSIREWKFWTDTDDA